jgi:hypothetical protein
MSPPAQVLQEGLKENIRLIFNKDIISILEGWRTGETDKKLVN